MVVIDKINSPWQAADYFTQLEREVELKSWVLDSGSTTRRLREDCSVEPQITLLFQGESDALADERQCLQVSADVAMWQRLVLIKVDGLPFMLGRTIVPASSLQFVPELQELGVRPLGELLFVETQPQRSEFELALLSQQHVKQLCPLIDASILTQQTWGRRSLFTIGKLSLLLTELFLQHPLFRNNEQK